MIRIDNTQYFYFLQHADALRRSGSFCDAIISVRSQTFRAHRLVLACASRVLAQQLVRGDMDSPVHCMLECLSPETFQQVLDFTYTQTLEVSVDDLHQLLRAAQLLEMKPLEEQCQKQLDTLDCRTEDEHKKKEAPDVKGEKDEEEEVTLEEKGHSVQEELESSSPESNAGTSDIITQNISPRTTPGPRKRPRPSPMSAPTPNRDSVISRPVNSMSSFASPWNFPTNMWNSVNTFRWIRENHSAHHLQSTNQSPVTYPITLSTPHVFPLLAPHFQSSARSSVIGYPSCQPRNTQHLYAGSGGMRGIIKHAGKKASQRAVTGTVKTGELRYPEVHKDSKERVRDCPPCTASLLDDPALQESASTSPGENCAGCRFFGRGEAAQHESRSHRQDHRGEKPYQCRVCPKKFTLKHQLDTHHRVHTGEKPFECRLCGQRSRDYSAMIKHLRTHDGATPYRCTVCLEFCSSLVAMQKHIKSHAVHDFPTNWSINSTYLYTSHI